MENDLCKKLRVLPGAGWSAATSVQPTKPTKTRPASLPGQGLVSWGELAQIWETA